MSDRNEAIENMLIAIGETFDVAIAARENPGGQHTNGGHEWQGVGPGHLGAMRRWSRDFRRVLAMKRGPSVEDLERQIEVREKALERVSVRTAAEHFLAEHDAYSFFTFDAAGVAWQVGGTGPGYTGGRWAVTTGRCDHLGDAVIAAAAALGWTP